MSLCMALKRVLLGVLGPRGPSRCSAESLGLLKSVLRRAGVTSGRSAEGLGVLIKLLLRALGY